MYNSLSFSLASAALSGTLRFFPGFAFTCATEYITYDMDGCMAPQMYVCALWLKLLFWDFEFMLDEHFYTTTGSICKVLLIGAATWILWV
jgi:hypothetical protein